MFVCTVHNFDGCPSLPNTLRKRKSREIESSDKRVLRQKTDSSNKRVKRAAETIKQWEE